MKTWYDFLPAAMRIVQAEKAAWPGCEGVVCVNVGGEDTEFRRIGQGVQSRAHTIPAGISNLIDTNLSNASIDPALASQQSSMFSRLMSDTAAAQPGYSALSSFSSMSPTDYTAYDTLRQIGRRDPYGGTFESDTHDAFTQRASDALATVQSGPNAVRGADARSGLAQGTMATRLAQERGGEVRQAQLQDLMGVLQASTGSADIENKRVGSAVQSSLGLSQIGTGVADRALGAARQVDAAKLANMGLLQLAAELQGTTTNVQNDDFSGRGSQSGWGSNVGCCFIFAEALNGELPWFVQIARFELITPARLRGYRWMAKWLVPQMQARRWVAQLVNAVIVKPFLRYGAWLYQDVDAKQSSALLAPYCNCWLALWSGLGKVVK